MKFFIEEPVRPLETLHIALETGIAAQLTMLVLLLIVGTSKRQPAGFFLLCLCGALLLEILLNALSSLSILPGLRMTNYFVDLVVGPLLLGLVARSGGEAPLLRRNDLLHLLGPVVGAMALAISFAPDALVCASQTLYFTAAAFVGWRRQDELRHAGLLVLTTLLGGAFALALVMRIRVVFDASVTTTYRDSPAYVWILALALGLVSSIMWLALCNVRPGWLSAANSLSAAQARALAAKLMRLINDERLYLDSELTLADVAARMDVPARTISKVMSSQIGENFSSYVNRQRVESAATALQKKRELSVTTILYDSGFGSKSAFQREFKRHYGVSPTQYRRAAGCLTEP